LAERYRGAEIVFEEFEGLSRFSIFEPALSLSLKLHKTSPNQTTIQTRTMLLSTILLFPMDPIARTMVFVPLITFAIILLTRYAQDYLANPDLFDVGPLTVPIKG